MVAMKRGDLDEKIRPLLPAYLKEASGRPG